MGTVHRALQRLDLLVAAALATPTDSRSAFDCGGHWP